MTITTATTTVTMMTTTTAITTAITETTTAAAITAKVTLKLRDFFSEKIQKVFVNIQKFKLNFY